VKECENCAVVRLDGTRTVRITMSAILAVDYGLGDKDGVVVSEVIEVSVEGVKRHDSI
jgi:hypothetical protein